MSDLGKAADALLEIEELASGPVNENTLTQIQALACEARVTARLADERPPRPEPSRAGLPDRRRHRTFWQKIVAALRGD